MAYSRRVKKNDIFINFNKYDLAVLMIWLCANHVNLRSNKTINIQRADAKNSSEKGHLSFESSEG